MLVTISVRRVMRCEGTADESQRDLLIYDPLSLLCVYASGSAHQAMQRIGKHLMCARLMRAAGASLSDWQI